jgi:hypothetical protein
MRTLHYLPFIFNYKNPFQSIYRIYEQLGRFDISMYMNAQTNNSLFDSLNPAFADQTSEHAAMVRMSISCVQVVYIYFYAATTGFPVL